MSVSIRNMSFGVVSLVLGVASAGCGDSTPPAAAPTGAAVAAQQDPGGGGDAAEAEHHRQHHHGGVAGLIALSLKDLDLSPTEKPNVEKIRTDLMAKLEPGRAAGKNLANVLADGVSAGNVDHAKVDAAITQLTAAMAGLHDATADALNQLHNALTPAERAALIDKIQGHWQKWKDAQGHDEQADEPKDHRGGHLVALAKELTLTQDQVDKIKGTFASDVKAIPQQTHDHKEVEGHFQAFATAFKADAFDAKSLSTETGANTHMATWGATRMAHFIEAVAPVLTPDQRGKLAQQIREHASRPEPL